jgi:hypothetical protein
MRALLFMQKRGSKRHIARILDTLFNSFRLPLRKIAYGLALSAIGISFIAVTISPVRTMLHSSAAKQQPVSRVTARKGTLSNNQATKVQKHSASSTHVSNVTSTVIVDSGTRSRTEHSDVTVNGQKISVPANGTFSKVEGNSSVTVTHSESMNSNDSSVSLNVQSIQQSGGE